jgi:hypothetical protein
MNIIIHEWSSVVAFLQNIREQNYCILFTGISPILRTLDYRRTLLRWGPKPVINYS